jgi:hypothetical protein
VRRPRVGYGLALGGAGLARVALLFSSSGVITPDTFDYVRQSRLPLWSAAFWGSQHPPLLSLLWKPLPGLASSLDPVRIGSLAPALLVNSLVGAACWGFLAVTLSRLARTATGGWAVLAGVLGLSLLPEVAGWDRAGLSESVSLSLVALVLACSTGYVRRPSRGNAVGLGAAVLAATLARDTNVVLCVVALVPVLLAVRRRWAPVAACLVLACALSLYGQLHGHRSSIPTRNAIASEIVRHGAAPWFRAHGLPWRADTVALMSERPPSAFDHDPRAATLRAWLDAHARTTWVAYLRTHPTRTTHFFSRLGYVYAPSRALFEPYWGARLRGPAVGVGALLGLALLALAGLRRSRDLLVLASFGLATLPLGVLIWDADALEFERHAVVIPVLARVVLLAGAVLGVETLYARARNAAVSIPKYVGAS